MRDTNKDWNIIGDVEPYFGVLTDQRYLKKNITPQLIDEFYLSGVEYVDHTLDTLQGLSSAFSPKTALDFGCGVGRLLAPMCRKVDLAYGVDVSKGMLNLLSSNLSRMDISNYELFSEIPDIQVDWINSIIVLQHIPPDVGYELIKKLWSILKAGGGFSIQFPIYKDKDHLDEVFRDVNTFTYDGKKIDLFDVDSNSHIGSMSMYDYDFSKVISMLDLGTGARMLIEKVNHGGCHGIKLYTVK